jgi:hypothetical protein
MGNGRELGGSFMLGPWRVRRAGYGAMQLAGDGVFGPPRDRDEALQVMKGPEDCCEAERQTVPRPRSRTVMRRRRCCGAAGRAEQERVIHRVDGGQLCRLAVDEQERRVLRGDEMAGRAGRAPGTAHQGLTFC